MTVLYVYRVRVHRNRDLAASHSGEEVCLGGACGLDGGAGNRGRGKAGPCSLLSAALAGFRSRGTRHLTLGDEPEHTAQHSDTLTPSVNRYTSQAASPMERSIARG